MLKLLKDLLSSAQNSPSQCQQNLADDTSWIGRLGNTNSFLSYIASTDKNCSFLRDRFGLPSCLEGRVEQQKKLSALLVAIMNYNIIAGRGFLDETLVQTVVTRCSFLLLNRWVWRDMSWCKELLSEHITITQL